MRGLNAKKQLVYHESRFYKKKPSSTLFILIYLFVNAPDPTPCLRLPDNLLPSNQLLTYIKPL